MKALDFRLVLNEDVIQIGSARIVTRSYVTIDIAVRDINDLKIPVFKLPVDPFITYDQLDGYWAGFPVVGERLPAITERVEIYPFVGEWGTMFLNKVEARAGGIGQFLAISGSLLNPSDRLKSLAVRKQSVDQKEVNRELSWQITF